ncbi:MAG TPA: hypothetical protein VKY89_11310 [Thermoanaerobaculia bacterium]|jgi:hypothetical protein|nr:hypothetical protein [Thermoanaerobaculia bacterium]
MKKQPKPAKLALHRETLVNLDLDKIAAGGSISWPCSHTCASACPCTD